MSDMNPKLFYTLKLSHLQTLERELRTLHSQIVELHTLERSASAPEWKPIEDIDTDFRNLLATVQCLRTEVQPLV